MVRNEYLRFMQTLKVEGVQEGVRKIANMVLDSLDDIEPLGTHQGQRIKKIVRLVQSHWATTANEITSEAPEANNNDNPITQLKSLTVGPFRGFAKSEEFDLNSQLVLIYGPNGSGKSSFCEALEYGMLGSVEEAESKRFRQQTDYLKNANVNQFKAPEISAINRDGDLVPITPDQEQYRFYFVEKNRIDNFSRIAAHLPARQTELISTLFGLDSFNDFVRKFTNEMNGYISILGTKNQQLIDKQKTLEVNKQSIKTNSTALESLSVTETNLANQYKREISFANLVAALGTIESPGEIQGLESELQELPPAVTRLTIKALTNFQTEIITTNKKLISKQAELKLVSEGLSFKQLYSAVVDLSGVSSDCCPACNTPLDQVANNPFDLATQELEKLGHLSLLEQERDQLEIDLSDTIQPVFRMMQTATEQLTTDNQPNHLTLYVVSQESQINWDWWQSLHVTNEDGMTAWQQLHDQVNALEQCDINAQRALDERTSKQEKLKELRGYDKQVIQLQTQRKTLEDGIKTAKTTIKSFDEKNKELIAAVEAEKIVLAVNLKISTSYSSFVTRLTRYKDRLPGQLVADLGEHIVTLYNAFNRNDAPGDLLSTVKLPIAPEQRIKISFQSEPERYFDALHVLSEGHIRCVGLAILLAKNLKENCPVLIFDDPVNAIDDDHRECIRRTLFEDNYFQHRQIILTCHGEEFFKDIQNLLGAERTRQSHSFTFLPQLDVKHIRVDFNSAPRNYILAAQQHIERLETREALAKSRQALEALTKGKVWRYVNRYGDGNLSIKMRSANSPLELRNLTEQLKSKLLKADFNHDNKTAVLTPIETILGLNGESREWRYLNKGTHEENDRAEFDPSIVSAIVNLLRDLDVALT